jgi:Holliday junction DNA helicase RuvA
MIGLVSGIVELRDDPYVLVNVSGIGYKVLVSTLILSKNAQIGQPIKLFTYTHVREDALDLFGFLEIEDLKLFERLIGVSGVGPKTAMNIFSFGSRQDIIKAISSDDVAFFTAVPRLGKKNAQKVIIELKGKFGSIENLHLTPEAMQQQDELLLALKGFGFSVPEAQEAIRFAQQTEGNAKDKLRVALKYLGSKG